MVVERSEELQRSRLIFSVSDSFLTTVYSSTNLGVISGSMGWNSLDSGSWWSLRLTRVTLPPCVMLVTNLLLEGSWDLLLLTGLVTLLLSLATLLTDLFRPGAPILTRETPLGCVLSAGCSWCLFVLLVWSLPVTTCPPVSTLTPGSFLAVLGGRRGGGVPPVMSSQL